MMLSTEKNFLKAKSRQILLGNKPVWLKGVNLGGWLMMEGYIMHARNLAERLFKKQFAKHLGEAALKDFEREFRGQFIQEKDIQQIAEYGFNCIRVPFNCRLVENAPFQYNEAGLRYLDQVIEWAQKYKIWIILDLHGAYGSQNYDWHSDSLGYSLLWSNKSYLKRTFSLWEFLAARYRDNSTVVGYDLLNEAVLEDTAALNSFYQQTIKAIRSVDPNHILFIEGNKWATDINCLDDFADDNVVLSIHTYQPVEFTFNFIPHLRYPLNTGRNRFDKKELRQSLVEHFKSSKRTARPILVGEFGVNYRQGLFGEDEWLKDILAIYREFDFHWTYWTYKAIKNSIYPDGLYSYYPNSPWVNRQGPRFGWETYHLHWPDQQKEMIASWDTGQFSPNTPLLDILKDDILANH